MVHSRAWPRISPSTKLYFRCHFRGVLNRAHSGAHTPHKQTKTSTYRKRPLHAHIHAKTSTIQCKKRQATVGLMAALQVLDVATARRCNCAIRTRALRYTLRVHIVAYNTAKPTGAFLFLHGCVEVFALYAHNCAIRTRALRYTRTRARTHIHTLKHAHTHTPLNTTHTHTSVPPGN